MDCITKRRKVWTPEDARKLNHFFFLFDAIAYIFLIFFAGQERNGKKKKRKKKKKKTKETARLCAKVSAKPETIINVLFRSVDTQYNTIHTLGNSLY